MINTDIIIIGAGASGLMCAITAGQRGQKVIVLDHAKHPGTKILMSGGGRCNFTNLNISSENYISHNPHFCKSALKQYTQWDFIELVRKYNIEFEERAHGQLFCLSSSRDILDMMLKECEKVDVKFNMSCTVARIEKLDGSENIKKKDKANPANRTAPPEPNKDQAEHCQNNLFRIFTDKSTYQCRSLVIATGGVSIPSSGATPFGYQIAQQFGIKVWPPHAGLVPFTLNPDDKNIFAPLSGIAIDTVVKIESNLPEEDLPGSNPSRRHSSKPYSFRGNVLFTHRGLSGPAILQISSYWHPGESISLNFLPEFNLFEWLTNIQQKGKTTTNQIENQKLANSRKSRIKKSYDNAEKNRDFTRKKLKSILSEHLPKRLVTALIPEKYCEIKLGEVSQKELKLISEQLQQCIIKPGGTEGYRTAEVTVGGVDCDSILSKSMEVHNIKGLFFTGEVLDVTGWLGGYNLQWAWSSGWCAGMSVG